MCFVKQILKCAITFQRTLVFVTHITRGLVHTLARSLARAPGLRQQRGFTGVKLKVSGKVLRVIPVHLDQGARQLGEVRAFLCEACARTWDTANPV